MEPGGAAPNPILHPTAIWLLTQVIRADDTRPSSACALGGSSADAADSMSCSAEPDGVSCPESNDPCHAEICLRGRCVGTYVSTATGDDSNPGTRSRPKATIGAGVKQAEQLARVARVTAPVPVFVAAGVYAEDLLVPNHVDLLGGWAPPTWIRDVHGSPTQINPIDAAGVRFADAAMTPATVRFSGFTVRGSDSRGATAAATVSHGASPSLEDLTLSGGTAGTLGTSIGLKLEDARTHPSVLRSVISAGRAGDAMSDARQGQGRSLAIWASTGASVTVRSSSAHGGTATAFSAGLLCHEGCSGSTLTDAKLTGGPAMWSVGAQFEHADVSGIEVRRSTIIGGVAPTAGT